MHWCRVLRHVPVFLNLHRKKKISILKQKESKIFYFLLSIYVPKLEIPTTRFSRFFIRILFIPASIFFLFFFFFFYKHFFMENQKDHDSCPVIYHAVTWWNIQQYRIKPVGVNTLQSFILWHCNIGLLMSGHVDFENHNLRI